MNERVRRTLVCLLGTQDSQQAKDLLAGLSKEAQGQLDSEFSVKASSRNFIEPLEQRLQQIHYSWYQAMTDQLPQNLAAQALASVRSNTSSLTHRFWQYWLWRQLCEPQWLPAALLPEDAFAEALVALSKAELMLLLDLLGVVDLVPTLKKVIQPTMRKRWLSALSPLQQQFLMKIMKQPIWIGAKELAANAEMTVEDLNRLIHRRGCQRLGIAFAHRHQGWLWKLAHQLDRGRGCVVLAAASPKTSIEAADVSVKLIERCMAAMHDLHRQQ